MLITRLSAPADLPFILDSFTLEFRHSVYTSGLTRERVRMLVGRLLSNGWVATVLCEDGEPDEIMAYVIWHWPDPTHIAWVHTKGIYRRQKWRTASMLLEKIGAKPGPVYTPFIPSPQFARSARAKGWDLRHRPWMGL